MQTSADPANLSVQNNLLNQTLSPDVCHALDELFTLCRVPFVTDFLFTSDPVADISMLTSPVQNEHASVARICVSGTESVPTANAPLFNYAADIYFFSLPAFSVGAITVGFALQKRVDSGNYIAADSINGTPSSCGNETRPSCYRFVRDDTRGIFVLVSEFPTGVIEFDCMIHRSSRRRTRLCARFRSQSFRDALRTPGGTLNPMAVAPSLQYLTIAYEQRACPVCKSDGNEECGCELPFQRPAHPLDFRSERFNMALHTGRYRGSSIAQLFGGIGSTFTFPVAMSRLDTNVIIKGGVDQNLISSLCRLAVQDRLLVLSPNPLASSVPLILTQQEILGCSATGVAPTDLNNTKSATTSAIPSMPISGCNSSLLQGESSPIEMGKEELSSLGQSMDLVKSETAPSRRGDLLDSLFSFDDPSLSVPVESNNGVSNNTTNQAGHSDEASAANGERDLAAVDGDSSDDALSKTARSPVATNVTAADSEPEFIAESNSSPGVHRRTRGTGQDPESGQEQEHDSGENRNAVGATFAGARVNKERSRMDERAARAEERRRRNRLAAAKSNVKRKIRNETLKRDLSEARQRVSELREKEKELRAENVRLRVKAHEQKMNVGIHLTHIQMTTA